MQKPNSKTKWIIVTGGVLSGLGKGIVSASIARLFSNTNKIVPIKCDGYLNVDPGTMNPIEHGEVFVLEDGGEVDMDFGHYERFLNIDCSFDWNLTSGKVFKSVIDKERHGDYLGKTVQMIPHVTDEIKSRLFRISRESDADIMLVEVGGTIGDIETMLFVEALRQLRHDLGRDNTLYVHLTLVPQLSVVGEEKTKPTQQSVSLLLQRGIQPDMIIGRSDGILSDKSKAKIALFCSISKEEVISDPDLSSVYELPLIFEQEGLVEVICNKLKIKQVKDMKKWRQLVNNIKNPKHMVKVALCGKYTHLHDSYVSILEALIHAGAHNKAKVHVDFVETTDFEDGKKDVANTLKAYDGIIVPGGFGSRGTEGKMMAIKYARENNLPFLGLCLGLQMAVAEFARNVCGLKKANSSEIDKKTPYPIIDILPEQQDVTEKGGTMRLGGYLANLKKNTKVYSLYKTSKVSERHRHRFEVNPDFHEKLEQKGMIFSGMSPDRRLVEFIELKDHKFFVATQAHPELKSRLERPAPLFLGFVKSCLK